MSLKKGKLQHKQMLPHQSLPLLLRPLSPKDHRRLSDDEYVDELVELIYFHQSY